MRMIIGMILGCLLTIGAVYARDSMATSTVATGTNASTSEMIVNWDVAEREWTELKADVHTAWLKLKASSNPVLIVIGEPGADRTRDLLIKSQTLYH